MLRLKDCESKWFVLWKMKKGMPHKYEKKIIFETNFVL